MKKPAQHLIAEGHGNPALSAWDSIGIDLADVWSNYCMLKKNPTV
jgi:hypothetical protein